MGLALYDYIGIIEYIYCPPLGKTEGPIRFYFDVSQASLL